MRILPSPIVDVDIAPLEAAVVPAEAVPFSVAIHNGSDRTIALIGVRFDMTGPRGEKYAVVHYADMLRDPLKAELKPGAFRAMCAEPSYTMGKPDARSPMNLRNLKRMLRIQASLDCVAFDDGRFEGPDTRGAFERLNASRAAEAALAGETKEVLARIAGDPKADKVQLAAARRLLSPEPHKPRIELWKG